ncbi:hypothetical protein I4U23_022029 [Adineta vaga]|nr:hypothetical protein I4U23_022029 [Adineta vaga]
MNQLYKPVSIAFDSQQNLYVSDPSYSRIQKYSRNSQEIVTLVKSVKAGQLFIDRYDNLYFTVSSSHIVQKRSAVGGSVEVVAGNGRYGAALNQLNSPKDVYVDREESVYVVDMGNQRIVKSLKKSTTGIILFGGIGVLKNPVGLFVDDVNELGAVYVCTHHSKVVKWMPDTQQLITVAGSDKSGSGIHQLLNPQSIFVETYTKVVYVVEPYELRVTRWLPNALGKQVILDGQTNKLQRPEDMAFDQNWNLYVVESLTHRVQKFLLDRTSCPVNKLTMNKNRTLSTLV